jgi:type I restriction enzyme S subunit
MELSEAPVLDKVMPGYKKTDVGVIPEDWKVVPLDQIAFVTSGKRLPLGKSLIGRRTEHPYIRVTDMRPGTVDTTDIKYVPDDVFPAIQQYRIYKEDLFISVAGTLGIVGKVPEELDGANLTENANRITRILCSRDYLLHVLLAPLIQTTIDSLRTVGAQPKLALGRIRKFDIPLPPTDVEQRAIARVLSDVDELLGSLDALIAKKKAIKQGAMQQLLTGQKRLPGFEGEWEVKRLYQITSIPITDGPHLTPRFYNDGIPFLSVNNLVDNKVDMSDLRYVSREDHEVFSRKCKPIKHDILFGKAASVGKVALVDFDTEFNVWSPIALIRINQENDSKFVHYALQGWSLLKQILLLTNSSSQGNIGMGEIKLLEFQLPNKEEQTAIAAVLSDMDAEIAALEARRAKTALLKQGMMQELLTGRTRLVNEQTA